MGAIVECITQQVQGSVDVMSLKLQSLLTSCLILLGPVSERGKINKPFPSFGTLQWLICT